MVLVWLDGARKAKKAYQAGGISAGEFLRRIDVDGGLDDYKAARDTFPAPGQTPWRDYIKRDMDFVPGKRFTDMLYLDLSADAPAWTMITAEEQVRKARGGHASLRATIQRKFGLSKAFGSLFQQAKRPVAFSERNCVSLYFSVRKSQYYTWRPREPFPASPA